MYADELILLCFPAAMLLPYEYTKQGKKKREHTLHIELNHLGGERRTGGEKMLRQPDSFHTQSCLAGYESWCRKTAFDFYLISALGDCDNDGGLLEDVLRFVRVLISQGCPFTVPLRSLLICQGVPELV
jgi:hypothetical protein